MSAICKMIFYRGRQRDLNVVLEPGERCFGSRLRITLRSAYSGCKSRHSAQALLDRRELREKDNLAIEWEPKKAGRKVTDLMFKFKPEQQGRIDL